MPSSYLKDIFREIKISLGRFLSILCIVAIGVAFFAGIKASAPDMKNSADMYFDKYNVQDIQIYSTLGLTKKDVKAIQKLKGVKAVQPNFSMDTLSQIDSTQMVIKVISYEIDQKMNKIRIVEGRMPERENECLIEASSATNKLYGTFHIGDTIKLQSGTDEALSNSLKNTKYKIVGTCYNPNYLSYEKGSSNIGSGTVNSFIYIQNSNVLKDYYTEVDVCVKGAKELDCYSDAYFDVVDPVLKRIKKIANKQIDVRIQSYQSKLDEKKQEANDELNDAENKLNDAQDKIDSGLAEIQSNEIKLQNSKNQIDQGWNEYYANLQLLDNIPTLQNAIAQIEESEQKLPELLSQKEQAENGLNQINAAMDDLNMQRKMIQDSIDLIDISIEKAQNTPTTDESSEAIKNKVIENLNNGKVYLQGKIAEIDSTIAKKAELEAAIPQLQDAIDQIQAGVAKKAELQSQLNQLLNAKNQLNSAYVNLINGESQYEDGVSKIQDAKNEINSNIEKLALSKAEFNVRKHDALREINEAQEEIDKMEGKWIVLDRDSHYSYRDYGACADRMDGIAKVFPVFFFLVAALVCMTTMTRMVDEQRNEMGTLKALGYSMNTTSQDELNAAYNWLIQCVQTMDPEIVTDEIIDNMAQARKALGLIYSGDAAYVMSENENMGFYMPKSGTNLWSDAMVIPKNAKNPKLANEFIRYITSYDAAMDNSSYVGYTSPNKEVTEELGGKGGDYDGINAYTPRAGYDKDEVFQYDETTRKIIADLWSRVKVAASNAH